MGKGSISVLEVLVVNFPIMFLRFNGLFFAGRPSVSKILLQHPLRVGFRLMLRKTGWNHPKWSFFCVNLNLFAHQAQKALSSASGRLFWISCRSLFLGKNYHMKKIFKESAYGVMKQETKLYSFDHLLFVSYSILVLFCSRVMINFFSIF